MKVMSAVQARLHASLKQDLKLIADIIATDMGPDYEYEVAEADSSRVEDFAQVDIIPVSDPNAASMAQRVVQGQAVLQLAQTDQQAFDMPLLYRDFVTMLGVQNADKIVKDPEDVAPMDPVSENMALLMGKPVLEVQQFKRNGVRVIDVLRGDASLRRDLSGAVLESGDRVVLRTEMSELLGMQNRTDMRIADKLSSVETETVEVLITPGCRMVGRTLGELRLRRRYGVYVLAAHRRSQNIGRQLDELVVQVGDTLLLEGTQEDIKRLASFDVAPIYALGFLAVALILITRCIDSDEALGFVDGRLMAMIFAMLAVGEGLDQSGAVALIVGAVEPWMAGLPPFAMILAIYLLGLIMTEFLSNNAVAVIYTPIAIQLAHQLGVDPRPFVVAVMFSATLAFATPIGYQTNMMVYGPGGYKFLDFTRIGLPLNVITWLLCSALIPLIWPLYP